MTGSTAKVPEPAALSTPAPLWRRLAAMVYDTLLLVAIVMAYGYAHLGIKVLLLGETYQANLKTAPAGATADPLMFVGMLAVIFLFFHIFWRHNGQTLGMQAWRIRIQQQDGKTITAVQTLLRLLIAPLSASCLGIGYLWCLFGSHRTWHDMATHTRVVLIARDTT